MKFILKYLIITTLLKVIHFAIFRNVIHIPITSIYTYLKLENFLVFLVVPFLEEIIFRWGLKWNKFSFPFLINSIAFAIIVYFTNYFYSYKDTLWLILNVTGLFICSLTFLMMFYWIKKNETKAEKLFLKYFEYVFWGSIILFTLSHYQNYENYKFIYKLSFLTLIFIDGYFFSKIRLEKNLIYSIVLHFLVILSNTFILSMLF